MWGFNGWSVDSPHEGLLLGKAPYHGVIMVHRGSNVPLFLCIIIYSVPPPPDFFLYFFLHFNNKWTHPNDNILHRWNSGWTRSLLGQLIVPYRQGSCACACLYFEVTMTSCNGNIFRVTGPFWGETTGCWWIPLTKARDGELWYFLWSAHEQAVEQTIETRVI